MKDWLRWGGGGVGLAGILGVMARVESESLPPIFVVLYIAAGAVFLVAVPGKPLTVGRGWLVWIAAAGLTMRLLCLSQPPRYETDYHRYLWEGAVVAQGGSPYATAPQTAPGVNHPHLTSIYPPVAQAAFALAYRLAPGDATALRLVFLVADVGTAVLLGLVLRRLGKPVALVAVYWWNPIVVKEFYIGAHMDAVATLLAFGAVMLAVWQWRRAAWVTVGVAVGAKLWPAVLAPVLLRRESPRWWIGAAVIAVAGLVVTWPLVASWREVEDAGLRAYAERWENNSGAFRLLQVITTGMVSDRGARVAVGAAFIAWVAFVMRRPIRDDEDELRRGLWVLGGLFLLSPTQFPWYYTWLLPWAAAGGGGPLLWYTALLPLYHWHYEYPWVRWLEHLPVWGGLAWCAWRRRSVIP